MPVNRSSQSAASHGAAGPSKDSFLLSALSHAAECPKDLESLLLAATGFVPELTQLYGRQPTRHTADCVKSEVLSERDEHSALGVLAPSRVKTNTAASNRKHKYEQASSQHSPPTNDADMDDAPASNMTAENRKERRRRQLRSAQRAYRVRKATEISSLTDRISQLESALAEMGSTVISLSDMILSSDIREKDPRVTAKLQQTIQKCLVLTRESGSKAADASAPNEGNTASRHLTPSPTYSLTDHSIPARLPLPELPVGKSITYSLFIDRLRISIAHYACTNLIAGKTPTNRNFNPLWLLRAVMDKQRMISFFSALLHARITRVQLGTEWDDVPVFSIGGAGSHYVDPSTSSLPYAQHHSDRSSRWRKVQVNPKALPAKAHNELRDDWFDAQDLECYLEKKSVHLYTPPSSDNPWAKPPMQAFAVNITRLIAELLDVVICLGRTPGFRVTDVDRALSRAMLAG